MLNLIIFSLLPILSFAGSLPADITQFCEKNITNELKYYKSKNQWVRVADSNPGHKTYRSPTEIFGQWVEINSGDVANMFVANEKGIKEIRWNPKTCEVNKSTAFEKDKVFQSQTKDVFTDNYLKSLLDKKGNVIIYTWSPRMVYSVKLLEDYATVATKMGFKFLPLLDPEVSSEVASEIVGKKFKHKIMKVGSNELIMRQMITHYPSTLVIYKGEMIDPFIFGAMPKAQLEFEINARVNSKIDSIIKGK